MNVPAHQLARHTFVPFKSSPAAPSMSEEYDVEYPTTAALEMPPGLLTWSEFWPMSHISLLMCTVVSGRHEQHLWEEAKGTE